KTFFVDALGSALDFGIGTPEDVIRHLTPDVLSIHLPRPLWARLLAACLGTPKLDAMLIIETIGVPNLCEHIPSQLIWNVISELGGRALGGARRCAFPPAKPVSPSISAPPARVSTPARGVTGTATVPARGAPLTPPPPAAEPVVRPAPAPVPAAVVKTS